VLKATEITYFQRVQDEVSHITLASLMVLSLSSNFTIHHNSLLFLDIISLYYQVCSFIWVMV
jgi:hypothetical protein